MSLTAKSNPESVDYIIIGAGSAGCALAARLSERGHRQVLLLEAGIDDPWIWMKIPLGAGYVIRSPRVQRRFYTEPEANMGMRRIFWPRGKVLGGTSSINGMIWARGEPEEFDNWLAQGNTGWGYADVLPVYKRMERYAHGDPSIRGMGGPVSITRYSPPDRLSEAFIAACEQAGIPRTADYNGAAYEGVGYLQFNTRRGLRHGGREAYLRPALERGNLHLLTGTMVQRILFEGKRAVGVLHRRPDGTMQTVRATREVILSAGAIQSPQLLELSGVGKASFLQSKGIPVVADLPGVGENLRDHAHTRLSFECNAPITLNDNLNNPLRKMLMGAAYLIHRNGPMSVTTATVHALTRSGPGLPRPDVKIQLHTLTGEGNRDAPQWRWDGFSGFAIGTFQLKPLSQGSTHIDSLSPDDDPIINANYLSNELDRKTCIAALRLARRVAEQPALRQLIVKETRPGSGATTDDALLAHIAEVGATSFHPIGTCKMGSDPMAVVDPLLRVRGLRNLRVADASIMPTMVASNTNAPSMMIGERCADFVQRDEDGEAR